MKNNIFVPLLLTIIIMTIPMVISSFVFKGLLENSLSVCLNDNFTHILGESQAAFKKLKILDPDPASSDHYKKNFLQIQSLHQFMGDHHHTLSILQNSYLWYIVLIILFTLGPGLIGAFLCSRFILKKHHQVLHDLLKKREQVDFLKNMGEWQLVAQKLVHEIKNSLTPMEMVVGISTTTPTGQEIIKEELQKLKNMLSDFSRFAKLPQATLQKENVHEFLFQFIQRAKELYPSLVWLPLTPSPYEDLYQPLYLPIDNQLFSQALNNILLNAMESNAELVSDSALIMKIDCHLNESGEFIIKILNNGKKLTPEEKEKLFHLSFTTKKEKGNMGLGLSIIRKIILEHQGQVEFIEEGNWMGPLITLKY